MKAILLAAGRGSRLQALTDERPKSLVQLNGEALMPRAIRSLREGGVSEIGIVAGYRHEMLQPYADHLFLNEQWSTTGIFHSLSMAALWLEHEPCLVSYSDIFFPPSLISEMLKADGDIVVGYDPHAVSLWAQRFADPLSDLERFAMDTAGNIREIGGRADHLGQIEGQYMGLIRLTPAGWSVLRQLRDDAAASTTDMTTLLARALDAGHRITAVACGGPWGEIDCASDIALYERLYPGI